MVVSNFCLRALTTLRVSVINEFNVNKQEETLKQFFYVYWTVHHCDS